MNSVKERIIQESAMMFARNGCKTITMDDLANAMGISKRTIYENFSDKKDLLIQCLQYFFKHGTEEIEKVLQSTENIIEAMFQTCQCNADMMRNTKDNLFLEIQKYYPDVYASTVLTFKEKHLEYSRRLLEKGQKDGVMREDLNPELTSLIIEKITSQIQHRDLFPEHNKELMMTIFMFNFARGLATEKGLKILDRYMESYIENTKKLS